MCLAISSFFTISSLFQPPLICFVGSMLFLDVMENRGSIKPQTPQIITKKKVCNSYVGDGHESQLQKQIPHVNTQYLFILKFQENIWSQEWNFLEKVFEFQSVWDRGCSSITLLSLNFCWLLWNAGNIELDNSFSKLISHQHDRKYKAYCNLCPTLAFLPRSEYDTLQKARRPPKHRS